MQLNNYLNVSEEVKNALANNKPVVALESTIISHGMPYPKNVETALSVEKIVRENGAVPQPSQSSAESSPSVARKKKSNVSERAD